MIPLGKAAVAMGMKVPANQLGAKATQRYFRIPFVRPADQNREGDYQKRGMVSTMRLMVWGGTFDATRLLMWRRTFGTEINGVARYVRCYENNGVARYVRCYEINGVARYV